MTRKHLAIYLAECDGCRHPRPVMRVGDCLYPGAYCHRCIEFGRHEGEGDGSTIVDVFAAVIVVTFGVLVLLMLAIPLWSMFRF